MSRLSQCCKRVSEHGAGEGEREEDDELADETSEVDGESEDETRRGEGDLGSLLLKG